jgi:hypothetical protein
MVMYAPAITMNPEITKAQIARPRPRLLTKPSAFVDEKKTKYPTIAQNVAGTKLTKKHISLDSFR